MPMPAAAPAVTPACAEENGPIRVLVGDDAIVLRDVEMPVLDGLSALPLLLEKKRDLVVIMASTLTSPNSEVSLKAISLGAVDCSPKPASGRDSVATSTYKQRLIARIRRFGAQRREALAAQRARPGA